jgi:hypothetical protein
MTMLAVAFSNFANAPKTYEGKLLDKQKLEAEHINLWRLDPNRWWVKTFGQPLWTDRYILLWRRMIWAREETNETTEYLG